MIYSTVLLGSFASVLVSNLVFGADGKTEHATATNSKNEVCMDAANTADLVQCWSQTGRILELHGRYSDAAGALNKALSIAESSKDAAPEETWLARNDLAVVYRKLGRLKEAEALLRKITMSPQQETAALATAFNNLGQVLAQRKRTKQAEEAFQHAIDIWEHTVGVEHPTYAAGLSNFAVYFMGRKNFTRAESLLKRAIEIDQMYYPENDPQIARDLNNAASLAVAKRDLDDAEALLRKASVIVQKSLPSDHPDAQLVRNNLNEVLRLQKRLHHS